jgi:hypothetical protein
LAVIDQKVRESGIWINESYHFGQITSEIGWWGHKDTQISFFLIWYYTILFDFIELTAQKSCRLK